MGAVVSAFHATFVVFATWVMLLPVGILRAFVIRDMWAWFVVPLGLPSITALHAFGLALFVGLFMDPSLAIIVAKQDESAALHIFTQGVVGWLLAWAAGALIVTLL